MLQLEVCNVDQRSEPKAKLRNAREVVVSSISAAKLGNPTSKFHPHPQHTRTHTYKNPPVVTVFGLQAGGPSFCARIRVGGQGGGGAGPGIPTGGLEALKHQIPMHVDRGEPEAGVLLWLGDP